MTGQYSVSFGPGKPTPGVKWILIITGISFLIQWIIGGPSQIVDGIQRYPPNVYERLFGLWKDTPLWKAPWEIVSYMFLHSRETFFHLIFNMFAVWMFGVPFERQFGTKHFLKLYFISGALTGLILSFFINAIGASAAVFGLLVSFAYFWPNARILVMFIIPMKAKTMVMIFGGMELLMTLSSAPGDKVAHSGHVLGALVGFIYLQFVFKRYALFRSFFKKINDKVDQVSSGRKEKKKAEVINKEQWTQDKVDDLLEKVSKQGIDSLTKKERDFLDRVSMNYKSKTNDDDDDEV